MAPHSKSWAHQKAIRWFALVWASAVYGALLALPIYDEIRETRSSTGLRSVHTGHTTLLDVNGPRVYLILAVPVAAALLTLLPWPPRLQRLSTLLGALLASAFVLLGLASVGLFFLPSAAALVVAAAVAESPSRPAI